MQMVNEELEKITYIPHEPRKLCDLLNEYCGKLRECSLIDNNNKIKNRMFVGEKRSSSKNNIQDASALYTFILKQIIEVASPILANSVGLPASLELEMKVRLIEAKALLGHFDWEGNS